MKVTVHEPVTFETLGTGLGFTEGPVIGDDGDRYDEAIAVWYPSRSAFLALMEFPGYLEAVYHGRFAEAY